MTYTSSFAWQGFETLEVFKAVMTGDQFVCTSTPGGTVTIQVNNSTVCTINLIVGQNASSGTCAIPTGNFLANNTYVVDFNYSGDLAYAASTTTLPLTVQEQETATYLNLSSPGAVQGLENNETLSVQVISEATGTPAGKVTVSNSNTNATICTITLSAGGGSCALTASQLANGTYSLVASYPSDDPLFTGSTSAAQSLTVGQNTTATSLDASNPSTTYGREDVISWDVEVFAPSGNPTGTATVKTTTGITLCQATIAGAGTDTSGSCNSTKTALPAGTYSVIASYSGNNSELPSSGVLDLGSWVVAQASANVQVTNVDLEGPNGQTTYGSEAETQFTATVTNSFVTPTGKVTITDDSNDTLCVITLSGGTGSCELGNTEIVAGNYQTSASYNGGTNFVSSTTAPSPSGLTVAQAFPQLSISVVPGTVAYGNESTVSINATVTPPAAGTPTGTVRLASDIGVLPCVITLSNGSGSCSMSDTQLPPGTYTQMSGLYSGDPNFQAAFSSVDGTLTVNGSPASTGLQLSAATVAYGNESSVQFTATMNPQFPAVGTPTGTVNVTDASNDQLCQITLSGGTGVCTMTNAKLPGGNYQITGTYSGDQSFAGSTSSPQALTVTPVGSKTSLALSSASAAYGHEQAEKFTAKVSSPKGTPTGTVTVAEGSTTLCQITLSGGTGSCSPSAVLLLAGTHKVTAKYAGDGTFNPSASTVSKLTITKEHSATTLTLSSAAVRFGHEHLETLTAQVKPQFRSTVTGTVTFTAKAAGQKAVPVCVITLKAGKGTCALKNTSLAVGKYQLAAVYHGSKGILPSTSPAKTLTVER